MTSLTADEDENDYDSNEDDEDKAQDDDDSWDRPSTVQAKVTPQLDATSTSSPSTTQKVTQRTATSSSSAIDPYFTHFDPRAEHQSYKVKVRHFRYALGVQRRVNNCSLCLGCPTATRGDTSRESNARHEGLVRSGREVSRHASGRSKICANFQATYDRTVPGTIHVSEHSRSPGLCMRNMFILDFCAGT